MDSSCSSVTAWPIPTEGSARGLGRVWKPTGPRLIPRPWYLTGWTFFAVFFYTARAWPNQSVSTDRRVDPSHMGMTTCATIILFVRDPSPSTPSRRVISRPKNPKYPTNASGLLVCDAHNGNVLWPCTPVRSGVRGVSQCAARGSPTIDHDAKCNDDVVAGKSSPGSTTSVG